jgi:rRNA maturation RNase YbeY
VEFRTTYEEELHRVIVHGVLHLMGFKDKSEDEALLMRQHEDKALELLKTL